MAPSDNGLVVCPTEITDPTYNEKQAVEGNIEKTSYATKVLTGVTPATTNIKHPRESVTVKQATHNGVLVVIFKSKDYYGAMVEECKLRIVGRFLKPRPQIEKIRSVFKELFPIKGSAKIGVYDTFNVFIDFTNEDDFYKIVASIGTPLGFDAATTGKTRPSLAKVWVEVNLLKKLPDQIWVGLEDEGIPLKGYFQKIEYENILKYCKNYKKLGHNVMNCRVLERIKTNEAKEIERNAINLDDNGKQNSEELESSNIKEKDAENIEIIEENKNVGKDNEADNGKIGLTVTKSLNNNKKKKKGEKKKAKKKEEKHGIIQLSVGENNIK
ncbi:hypothetical protein KY285_010590 [Solanum tuberosum]|nr:hypothetical protein KY289_011136 [Solanum tuberosum]KAH0734883.1 hypothetical protein KY285_010590 [Solanum tuberosum]